MTAPATPPSPPEATEGGAMFCPECDRKLDTNKRHCGSRFCPWLRCPNRRCRRAVDVAKGLSIIPASVHRDY